MSEHGLHDPEIRAGEDQENGEAELQSTEMEARWIAWHVGVLLREGRLPTREDPKGRPITPSDIAVLLRSPSGRDEIFAREFHVSAASSSLALSATTGCLAIAMLVVGAIGEGWPRKATSCRRSCSTGASSRSSSRPTPTRWSSRWPSP